MTESAVPRRVLIVDSDPSFGQSLESDFTTRTFDVEATTTAGDAIARMEQRPFDLVVLDLDLPAGAALELLRRWKTEAPATVVILVSGHASLALVVDALKEGARRFFAKPVSAAVLLAELDERKPVPHAGGDHQLGTALDAEGVNRFFAISPGLMSVAGFDGYFTMLNPAWEGVLGYTVDELCAMPYLDLVHPEDREKATDEALDILADGETVFRFKNRYRCKDGSYRWLQWSATPSPDHKLIYASARDVTKTVRMEQGLRDANEQLKRLVASREDLLRESSLKNDTLVELGRFKDEATALIVHDLKNPLSVIVANYDYIIEGFEGPATCLQALEDSKNAGHRMLRLLTNLVDVAHLENGTLEVTSGALAISELLQRIADQRRVLARERRVTLVVTSSPHITITVDTDLVTRTIENIFDNALRHTPVGGSIEIEVRELSSSIEIRIGNSGHAIPIGARKSIFDKYQHSSPAIGRMNFGLGLYFCRLAIEAQGGEIWVEETDRLPTVFGIRLPRMPASRGATPEAAALTS
jgi:PAS domain S-box-containing protein